MARSISGLKKFPGLSKHPDGPSVTKFGLTRRSPRCAQCLKFKADDPSKIGEDEFGKLLRCSKCKKVNYCSKDCAEKNFPFHHSYCEGIKYGIQNSESLEIFTLAVMGEDAKLCEELLDFAANDTIDWKTVSKEITKGIGNSAERDRFLKQKEHENKQPTINVECNVILLFLGRDQEAYEFLKYSVSNFEKETNYELFKSMPKKYGNPNSRMQKFFAMDFFKSLLITTQKCMPGTQTSLFVALYWLLSLIHI